MRIAFDGTTLTPGRTGVVEDADFAGRAFAASVAAVVEDHRRDAQLVQRLHEIVAMAEVSGIAVREQDHGPRPIVRNVPAMELRIVSGSKPDILRPEPSRPPIASLARRSRIDERAFDEVKQHGED